MMLPVKQKIQLKQKPKTKINLKPIIHSNTNKAKLVDLFTGTGAFTYAFQQTGKVEAIFANDMIENSQKIYDLNFTQSNQTSHFVLKDLNDIDVKNIPAHTILTG